jgi:LacI family repressor for deo operon, udp, cdd, tsx, nupC, and nupG
MRKPRSSNPAPSTPRIKDVAQALGMSVATVSRALSKPEAVNSETLKRVMTVVEKLEYRPNLVARSLRVRQTKLLLMVTPQLSPFFLEVLAGAEEAARARDFSMLLGSDGLVPDRELAYFDQVSSGRADGIISLSGWLPEAFAPGKRALPPIVAALEPLPGHATPIVRVDHRIGGEMATKHLIDLGHRRIAHISGHSNSLSAGRRRSGYKDALDAAGIPFDPSLVKQGDFRVESGASAMTQLLALDSPPTAVFAANDEMAFGAMTVLRARGLIVPDDMSVVGFDDQSMAAIYNPPLTTIHIPRYEIGKRAVEELIKVINGEHAAGEVLLRTYLVERESTAKPATKRLKKSKG